MLLSRQITNRISQHIFNVLIFSFTFKPKKHSRINCSVAPLVELAMTFSSPASERFVAASILICVW